MQLTQKHQCLWAGDPQHYGDVERFEPTCHLVRAGPPPFLPPPAVSRLFHPHLEKQQLKQLVLWNLAQGHYKTVQTGLEPIRSLVLLHPWQPVLLWPPRPSVPSAISQEQFLRVCWSLNWHWGLWGDKAFQKCFEDSPFTLGEVRLKLARLRDNPCTLLTSYQAQLYRTWMSTS